MPLSVRDIATYDAFGQRINSTGTTENSYRFAGEQFDSHVGQYYLRARYYDTSNGRFTGRDPFEGFLSAPLSITKYPYVHGNPVNSIDPSGMNSLSIEEPTVSQVIQDLLQQLEYYAKAGTKLIAQATSVAGRVLARAIEVSINLAPSAVEVEARLNHIPAIFWGSENPVTLYHTASALTHLGFTVNNPNGPLGNPIQSGYIPHVLSRAPRSGGRWYMSYGLCRSVIDPIRELLRLPGGIDLPFTPLWCDEYPFGSTDQGGEVQYLLNRVSLFPVPFWEQSIRDDSSQGSTLRRFYDRAEVLVNRTRIEYGRPESIFISFFTERQTYGIDRAGREILSNR